MSFKVKRAPQFLACLVSVLLFAPISGSASHLDVARLATQLNLASGQLAYELRGAGAYSSIRQRSDQLSREAADLLDAVRRNRSPNHVQSQFRDVSQRFASLEQAVLRLHRRDYSPYLFNELDRISGIYNELSAQFHYAGIYGYEQSSWYGSRAYSARAYSPPVIIYQQVPSPAYGIPRSFINPPPRQQYEQDHTQDRHDGGRRDEGRREAAGRDNERGHAQQLPNLDHHSPVLDRQLRLDNRLLESDTGGQGTNTETEQHNQY